MGEITSQTKVFIDFGAASGIAGSIGGAIWLQRLTKFQVTDARSTEGVKAIGVSGFAGVREKECGGTIAITELRQDVPQVDWRQIKRERKYFTLTTQDENNGKRAKFLRCRVSKIDRGADDEGMHTDEIEVVFGQEV
jgi:hypothetical protein